MNRKTINIIQFLIALLVFVVEIVLTGIMLSLIDVNETVKVLIVIIVGLNSGSILGIYLHVTARGEIK